MVPRLHEVRVQPSGERFHCSESETLLSGMARIGRKAIPAGCLSGGCGICKIRLHAGTVRKVGKMSRAHVSVEEEAQGVYLACSVSPLEGIEVEVLGKLKKSLGFKYGDDASRKSCPP